MSQGRLARSTMQCAARCISEQSVRPIPVMQQMPAVIHSSSQLSCLAGGALSSAHLPRLGRSSSLQSSPLFHFGSALRQLTPRCAFSTSARLLGPRNTYERITHRKRKRRFGFLARVKDRNGRKILQRRRAKGRKNLSH